MTQAITALMGRQVQFVQVESAVPEIFCLDTPEAPVIVINDGHFERLVKFRTAMFDPDLGRARSGLISQLVLETLGLRCLRLGNPDIGTLLYLRGIVERRLVIDVKENAREKKPHVRRLVEDFFPFVHELGHLDTAAGSKFSISTPIPDEILISALERTLNTLSWMTNDIRDKALSRAMEQRSGHSLGLDDLRGECDADIFTAKSLYLMAAWNARQFGFAFNPLEFVATLHREWNITAVMERTAAVARVASFSGIPESDVRAALLFPAAMAVRHRLMMVTLRGFAEWLATQDPLFPALSERGEDWGKAMDSAVTAHIDDCNSGIDNALAILGPQLMDFAHLLLAETRFSLARSAYAHSDTQRYLRVADRLHVSSPVLEALRVLVSRPTECDGTVPGVSRDYLFAKVPSADTGSAKHVIWALEGQGMTVCAFNSEESLRHACRRVLPDKIHGEALISELVRATDRAELEAMVEQQIGEHVSVTVEGTAAFDRLLGAEWQGISEA